MALAAPLWLSVAVRADPAPYLGPFLVLFAGLCLVLTRFGAGAVIEFARARPVIAVLIALIAAVGTWVRHRSPEQWLQWEWTAGPRQGWLIRTAPQHSWGQKREVFELHARVPGDPPEEDWNPGAVADLRGLCGGLPSRITLFVAQPESAVLGPDDGAPDGVRVIVRVRAQREWADAADQILNPRVDPDQRGWLKIPVNLPRGADKLRIDVEPLANNYCDRVWVSASRLRATLPLGIPGATLGLPDAVSLVFLSMLALELLRRRGAAGWIAGATGILLLYAPTLWLCFGRADDYYLLSVASLGPGFFTNGLSAGRPLAGLIWQAAPMFISTVDELSRLRMVGIASLALLGIATFRWLRRCDMPRMQAVLATALVITLPSCAVYASFAVCAPFPLAAAFAAYAVLFLVPPLRSEPSPANGFAPESRARPLLAGMLLAAALSLYQPSALYFWSLLTVALMQRPARATAALWDRAVLRAVLVGLATMVLYFPLMKLLALAAGVGMQSRMQLIPDSSTWRWLTGDLTPFVLRLWDIGGASGVSTAAAVGALVGWVLIAFRSGSATAADEPRGQRLLRFAAVPLLLVLTVSPLILSSDRWISFRVLLAPMAVVVFLIVHALRAAGSVGTRGRGWSFVPTVLLGAVAGCATVATARSFLCEIILPSVKEHTFIHDRILNGVTPETREIRVIRPGFMDIPGPHITSDEFGVPATYLDWNVEATVRGVLRDRGYLNAETLRVREVTEAQPSSNESVLLDMRELRRLRTSSLEMH